MAESTSSNTANENPTENIPTSSVETPDKFDKKETDNSDGDGGERPVREKLKKTSIAGLSQQATESGRAEKTNGSDTHEEMNLSDEGINTQRGRPTRKRSFEDLQQEDIQPHPEAVNDTVSPSRNSAHKRMRSRDVTTTENVSSNTKNQPKTEEAIQEENQSPEESIAMQNHPRSSQLDTAQPLAPIANGKEASSPQKKRSRDQFDKDYSTKGDNVSEASSESSAISGSGVVEGSDSAPKATLQNNAGEPEKKRHRDESLDRDQSMKTSQQLSDAPSISGFGNRSAISPFGTFGSSRDPKEDKVEAPKSDAERETQTVPSAFASSGMSAFAKSENSPFGAAGSTAKPNVGFGASETNVQSGFGFASSSGFGSGSGFGASSSFASARPPEFGGNTGNGFGSGFSGGLGTSRPLGGFSSFAAPTGTGGIIGATSNTKAFGAPEDGESDDGEDGDSEQSADEAQDERHKDKRFVEQEQETGEEEEETVFSCKAKLYHFDGKEWKERCVGTFKVNVNENKEDEDTVTKKARLIMRTEGVHRVALNAPIFKGMKVGSNEGQEPTGKMLNLAAMENGKAVPLLLKTGSLDSTRTLYHKIMDIQQEL